MDAKAPSIEKLINGKSPEELSRLAIAVALHEADFEFAETICFRLVGSKDETVRGNALLAFGHIARRAKGLKAEKKARDLIHAGLNDASEYVRSQATAAIDDIEQFIQK